MPNRDKTRNSSRGAGVAPVTNGTLIGTGRRMDEGEHISTTDARAGSTPHMTRYILVWGLGLVILAFVIILFVGR